MIVKNRVVIVAILAILSLNSCGDRAANWGEPANKVVPIIEDKDGDGYNSDVDPDDNNPCIPNIEAGTCDQDKDGLINKDEINIYKTDPKNPDTDGDTFNDGNEVTNQTDPLNPCDPNIEAGTCDQDKDGLTNKDEINIYKTDPKNPDTDGDTFNDGHEVTNQTDPLNPCDPNIEAGMCDQDKDGLTNKDEINIYKTDPKNPDTDGDIFKDGNEVTNNTDPLDPCDPNKLAGICDQDKDGLTNDEENNIYKTDPTNPDTDGDTLNDGHEVTNQTDPLDACDPNKSAGTCDQDIDGLTNNQEGVIGTDPKNPDTDGDGVKDGADVSSTGVSTALKSCLPIQLPLYRGYNNSNAMWKVDNCDGDSYINGAEDNISLAPKQTWISDPYNANSSCFVTSTTITNPCKSDEVIVSCEVVAKDGRTWLDRNLGACEVCKSSTDTNCYGSLYQWGRGTDGHQKRTNTDANTQDNDPNTFPYASPDFEMSSTGEFDWLTSDGSEDTSGFITERKSYWLDKTGSSICPKGWYVPTKAELEALALAEGITNSATAFASTMKLPVGGSRSAGGGNIEQANVEGYIWSVDTLVSENTSYAFTYTSVTTLWSKAYRATGYSVRCIKNP